MKVVELNREYLENLNVLKDSLDAFVYYEDHAKITVESWLELSEAQDLEMCGLMVDDKLVAIASLGEACDYRMDRWKETRSLYIHPEYHELKYGKALIHHLVDRNESRGYENTYFWVLESDKDVRDFFEKQNIIPNGNIECRSIDGNSTEFLRYVYVNV